MTLRLAIEAVAAGFLAKFVTHVIFGLLTQGQLPALTATLGLLPIVPTALLWLLFVPAKGPVGLSRGAVLGALAAICGHGLAMLLPVAGMALNGEDVSAATLWAALSGLLLSLEHLGPFTVTVGAAVGAGFAWMTRWWRRRDSLP